VTEALDIKSAKQWLFLQGFLFLTSISCEQLMSLYTWDGHCGNTNKFR